MKYVILAGFLALALRAGALEFTIAPLYFIDEPHEQADPRNTWHRKLLAELSSVAAGRELRFRPASSALYNPPQSVADALSVARAEEAENLIYGFITKREYTIQGELRLLDAARKDVIAVFYALDGVDREEELVKDLAAKLFRYIQETYRIVIISEPPAFTHLQFPLGLGYWFPAGANWTPLLIGIFRISGGVQLIPSDNVIVFSGYAHYFSFGLDLSYRLGTGSTYEAWDHSFTVGAPLQFHRVLNDRHEVYIGGGLTYSIDLLYIKKPYETPKVASYGAAGLLFSGGWTFRFKEKLYVFAELRTELRLYAGPMFSIAPSAGVILRPYTKEVTSQWPSTVSLH